MTKSPEALMRFARDDREGPLRLT